MAASEDKVLHELDGIKEYDNAMPGWLMAIWWGSLIFSAAYLIFFALSFGEGSMDAEFRSDTQAALTATQALFDANPIVPPSPASLLAGAKDPAILEVGAARFTKSCAACHGEKAQGLIGPNLTDDRWIHGGSVEQVFQTHREGLAGQGHAAVGARRQARGTVGARILRAQPPGLESAQRQAARGRPVRARADPGELSGGEL